MARKMAAPPGDADPKPFLGRILLGEPVWNGTLAVSPLISRDIVIVSLHTRLSITEARQSVDVFKKDSHSPRIIPPLSLSLSIIVSASNIHTVFN